MYKSIIQNVVFFKHIDNSGFIVKVVTSLKSIKGILLFKKEIISMKYILLKKE